MGYFDANLSVEENQANWQAAAEWNGGHLVPGGVAPGPDLSALSDSPLFKQLVGPDQGGGGFDQLDLSGVLSSSVSAALAGAMGDSSPLAGKSDDDRSAIEAAFNGA